MATLDALLTAARAKLATVSGSIVSEETIHTIRSPGRSPRHKEFAIGRMRTVPLRDRQKPADGMPSHHSLQLIAAFQLSPKSRQVSNDAAIQYEAQLRAKMLAMDWLSAADVACNIVYTGTDESAGDDGWIWFVMGFEALQTVTIS